MRPCPRKVSCLSYTHPQGGSAACRSVTAAHRVLPSASLIELSPKRCDGPRLCSQNFDFHDVQPAGAEIRHVQVEH
jgi:hypothetical protein